MDDDEILETLERMKKQVDEMSFRKVKVSDNNKHERRSRKDKEIIDCMHKLERLNSELQLLEEEEESILNAIKHEIQKK